MRNGRPQDDGRRRGPERPRRPRTGARNDQQRDGRQRPAPRERGHGRARTSTSPRLAAFDVLLAVDESDSYANLILPPLLRERGIHGRDAAFATELTYGTLRMQGRYDRIIESASGRELRTLDPPVLVVLRLGVHQLLAMRVPAHAAVSETVGLARERISAGPAQLVNAVLRRVSEKSLEEWLEEIRTGDADTDLEVEHSQPAWVLRAFRQALQAPSTNASDPGGALLDLLETNNTPAGVHLALRPGLHAPGDLDGVETTPGRHARTARYLQGGDPGQVPGIRSGTIGVQDEGSQLVTLATLAVPVEGEDSTWLDMCAGPGGKAALMASTLHDRGGGRFVANEVHEHRTRLVGQNLRALTSAVDIDLRTADGREIGTLEPGAYDRILLDAPCTGLGALRRRPEARWRRSPADLPELTSLQRQLLGSALAAVRVGGVVGYITCSPHVAETSLIVKDAIREAAKQGIEVEILDAGAQLNAVARQPLEGVTGKFAQLWPHVHGTDAMFLALLRRTA